MRRRAAASSTRSMALSGQEAVGDVAVGQARRGDEGAVGDPHAVVDLVALLQAAQDRDRVLDGGLLDVDRLEAPLERGVLLDVLLVLVQRRRADRAQLAAGEGGLQHVRGVHRPLGGAGADERVELVDEEDDRALGLLDLLEDGLQPVLELAAVLGAGDHGAEVERDDALVLQALGHVAHVDPAREALDDGGLADAGLADQDGVVLRAAREDLDDAADLLVAADDRVDLAAAGEVGQVARVALQGLVLVLGVGVRDARRAADFLEGLEQGVLLDARLREPLRRVAARLGEGEQEVLGRDVLVAELLGDLEGAVEDACEVAREDGDRPRRPRPWAGESRSASISRASASGSAPSFWRIGTTTPSSCLSRASRRWSPVSSALPRARASRWASWTASWALMVSWSKRMRPSASFARGVDRR